MTTLLPAGIIDPFTSRFDPDPYRTPDAPKPYHVPFRVSFTSLHPACPARAASPISGISIASAPVIRNNENTLPLSPNLRAVSPLTYRSAGALDTTKRVHHKQRAKFHRRSVGPKILLKPQEKAQKDVRSSQQHNAATKDVEVECSAASKKSQSRWRSKNSQQKSDNTQSTPVQSEPFPTLQIDLPSISLTTEYCAPAENAESPPTRKHKLLDDFSQTHTPKRNRQRLSEDSSVFVHTLKTASISNASFSIMPRSMRMGRSSDSQTFRAYLRYSIDSERPRTTSSIDEAAFSRGVRRKQILDELITTESSYIADLKALIYLYSTLLASTTSIPNSVRASIQRNVTDLLHLHETFQEKLHRAAFKSAARKWADTVSPTRLGGANYGRWRTVEARLGDRLTRKHRQRRRSSMESTEAGRSQSRIGTADPADVLDLVRIFEQSLPAFFAYEEYCANHEIMAHELQKQTPILWSTYEAGMESLGRTLATIDHKDNHKRKGLTVGDLLIKPIQRICKYPLLLNDLIHCTPVADSPGIHGALETVLHRLREIVLAVNLATDSQCARTQIQKRWLIQDRLNLQEKRITAENFRELGQVHLCGVLYVTYQTALKVDGAFALCILFDHHLIIALPDSTTGKFDLLCTVYLGDAKLECPGNGKGMQCPSALHTWKVCFIAHSQIHEVLLSACSSTEEEIWLYGLQGGYRPICGPRTTATSFITETYVHLKSVGIIFGPNVPLSRQSSIQRAATVSNRASTCQVILRNTNNPQDLQEYRNSSSAMVNRSHSHATTNKVIVLAPKRSERSKLESSLSDIWTKDRIPFPGMIANKGSQILRASAGSLVRKLSLASMHGPFSRRSGSLTVSSQKSYDTLSDRKKVAQVYQVRRSSIAESTPVCTNKPKEWSDLDTMDSVIGRMISGHNAGTKRLSLSSGERYTRKRNNAGRARSSSSCQVGPEDPASIFYEDDDRAEMVKGMSNDGSRANEPIMVEEGLCGQGRRKRWSHSIAKLKGIGSEGIRNMLYSSK